MKKRLLTLLGAAALAAACTSSDPVEQQVDKILKGMTLEEKIGQMVQLNVTVITDKDGTCITPEGEEILRKYKIGSILNTIGDKGAVTPDTYRGVIRRIQEISLDEMGIPCIYGLDQIHGATYTEGGTLFPQEINLGATFNREHPFRMGEIIAYETRACNVPWVFSPVMDLARNSAWPRIWESFGEDTYLMKEMGLSEMAGQQGSSGSDAACLRPIDPYHTGSSLKHFMAYGAAVSGQDRTPSSVSDRELKEKYFPPFEECCKAGALSIMVNSAMNDGIPFHCNHKLMTEWVKEGLGWGGFIVTDWADVKNLYERDHVASSYREAARLAINAGIDMVMDPYTVDVWEDIKSLVESGEISKARIDDAARRIIRAKVRLGLFEDPYGEKASYEKFACSEFEKAARSAAIESEVLLKNEEGLLPLSKDAKILVVGPNANSMRTLNGGWSYSWQGERADEEALTGRYNTILEALREKFSNVDFAPVLSYSNGDNWQAEEEASSLSLACIKAMRADVIIACIGENSYCETPGNIVDLNLSSRQKEMVKALSRTGKPIVLVLNEGRPRIINDIEPLAKAVVDIMLPGNYGGDALSALLCGEENFSGKLPFTYPKYPNRLATYDYLLSENRATMEGLYNYDAKMDVQWEFASGLSYTEFTYSGMKVDKYKFRSGDTIKVSVDVKNSGKVAGKEAVLLYGSDIYASITPEVRRLRDFTKIELSPGETKTVTFELRADDLAFTGHDLEKHLEKGEFRLACGTESVTIECL